MFKIKCSFLHAKGGHNMGSGTKYNKNWVEMGNRVRDCRKARGISRNKLAELIQNLPENTCHMGNEKQIGYIETGSRQLSSKYAEFISKALNVKAEYLLLKADSPHEIKTICIPGLEDVKRMVSAINFLNEQGIEIEQIHPSGYKVPTCNGFLSMEWPVVITVNNSIIWQGTINSVESVLKEICDYVWFKIERLSGGYNNG